MKTHLLRLPLCLALLGVLVAFGSANGQAKKNKNTTSPYAGVVSELHQTRVLLQTANHDYDGFRAKAVHEVSQAMHTLHPHHKHKAPTAAKVVGNNEAQAVSDMQLAQAGKQLQVILNQLTSGPANPSTTKAVTHVQQAITHLNTALKIR